METILIVDDNPENLKVLGEFIIQQGLNVDYANSGQQALDKIDANPPDLILLDIYMPGISGFDVCSKLKENPKHEEIPILFISAYPEGENVIKSFWVGGVDFIPKPFEEEVVMARVKTHLDLSRMRRKLEKLVDDRTEELREAKDELLILNQRLEKAFEQLKKLDDAKINFLQIISHEIRTPLNGISGFTHLLGERLKDSDYCKYVKNLKLSVERLEFFSKKALLISELQTQTYPLLNEFINIDVVLKQIKENYHQKLEDKKLSFIIQVDDNIDLDADVSLLMNALDIILENAIRFIPENAKITFRVKRIDEGTEFLIQDTGEGFPEDKLKNKFQLFSPGQEHVDKDFGLGLAAVKLIMDRHHGSADIGNNNDGGGFVKLIFPLKLKS